MKAITKHLSPYIYALLFFLIDIACCALFHKQLIYGLLCVFIIALMRSCSWILWSFLTLLLLLESFFYYGTCWVAFMYILPITILSLYMRSSFYPSLAQRYALLLLSIGTLCFYIEPYILGLSSSASYILTKIFATLFLLTFLTWFYG